MPQSAWPCLPHARLAVLSPHCHHPVPLAPSDPVATGLGTRILPLLVDAATGDFCSATVSTAEVHLMLRVVRGFFSGTVANLLCKGVIKSFQLTNKMQHCIMQSSCSAGRCIWMLNPQEGWFTPLKRCYGRERSRRSHMHLQAGETSPACSGVLPSPDRPLTS